MHISDSDYEEDFYDQGGYRESPESGTAAEQHWNDYQETYGHPPLSPKSLKSWFEWSNNLDENKGSTPHRSRSPSPKPGDESCNMITVVSRTKTPSNEIIIHMNFPNLASPEVENQIPTCHTNMTVGEGESSAYKYSVYSQGFEALWDDHQTVVLKATKELFQIIATRYREDIAGQNATLFSARAQSRRSSGMLGRRNC